MAQEGKLYIQDKYLLYADDSGILRAIEGFRDTNVGSGQNGSIFIDGSEEQLQYVAKGYIRVVDKELTNLSSTAEKGQLFVAGPNLVWKSKTNDEEQIVTGEQKSAQGFQNFDVSVENDTDIRVSWFLNSETDYLPQRIRIYKRGTYGNTAQVANVSNPSFDSSYLITFMEENTEYDIFARIERDWVDGTSDNVKSVEKTVTTGSEGPSDPGPVGVTVDSVTTTETSATLSISFSDAAGSSTITVQVDNNTECTFSNFTQDGNETCTVFGLTAGSFYTYNVSIEDELGETNTDTGTFTTDSGGGGGPIDPIEQ